MDNLIQLWDAKTCALLGTLKGHTKWVTGFAWEPLHKNPTCSRFASSSKDGTVKVWDADRRVCLTTFSQHTDAVAAVKWGEFLYSASRDRTIRVWDPDTCKLVKILEGHAHWINTMALNTDHVIRTGAYDHTGQTLSGAEAQAHALARYNEAKGKEEERLVSGSDDLTLCLWTPHSSKKPIARMTGHQALVNQVCFSPNGRFIASASFDKSIKLWNGLNGQYSLLYLRFIASLRGHVASVYQVSWSADSRLLVSASKDSTMKIWDIRTRKMKIELPGHLDEVYALDWSPDGQTVASGSKDRTVKM